MRIRWVSVSEQKEKFVWHSRDRRQGHFTLLYKTIKKYHPITMSYFSKWKRTGSGSAQPVVQRGRSQSLGIDALERSGIRALEHYVSDFVKRVSLTW